MMYLIIMVLKDEMFLEEMFIDNLIEGRYDTFVFKCIFVVGPPGSGKNYLINQFGLMHRGMKMVDIDEALMRLRLLKSGKNINYDYATPVITKRLNMWSQNYLGLIINTTGRSASTIINLDKQLKSHFYDTSMIYVNVDRDVARHRITQRPGTSKDITDKNRVVDLDYFESTYDEVSNNYEVYKTLFDKNLITINNNLSYDDINYKIQIENARKKLNKFLFSEVNPQARAIISGAKPANAHEISRIYNKNRSER